MISERRPDPVEHNEQDVYELMHHQTRAFPLGTQQAAKLEFGYTSPDCEVIPLFDDKGNATRVQIRFAPGGEDTHEQTDAKTIYAEFGEVIGVGRGSKDEFRFTGQSSEHSSKPARYIRIHNPDASRSHGSFSVDRDGDGELSLTVRDQSTNGTLVQTFDAPMVRDTGDDSFEQKNASQEQGLDSMIEELRGCFGEGVANFGEAEKIVARMRKSFDHSPESHSAFAVFAACLEGLQKPGTRLSVVPGRIGDLEAALKANKSEQQTAKPSIAPGMSRAALTEILNLPPPDEQTRRGPK
ncbi:hypothetical protein CR983_02215 [Candidatus Saccharibacteria bacterium]|nr:MAG: hypothetical protein CR983_02215 [Candidatus Saccharibacteria bacterium]